MATTTYRICPVCEATRGLALTVGDRTVTAGTPVPNGIPLSREAAG